MCVLLLCMFVLLVGFFWFYGFTKSCFAVTFICKWWQFFTCVHYFIPRKLFSFYISLYYVHRCVLFAFCSGCFASVFLCFFLTCCLSICICLENIKFTKLYTMSCVFDGRDGDTFFGEKLSARHSSNPKRNENQKYCH